MEGLDVVSAIPFELPKSSDNRPLLTVGGLQEFLRPLTQLVWGRFYFYPNVEAAGKAVTQGTFSKLVESTELTVCVMDNIEYAVFTKSLPLVCELVGDDWNLQLVKDELTRILEFLGDQPGVQSPRTWSGRPEIVDEAR
jgi:hypothetical protein